MTDREAFPKGNADRDSEGVLRIDDELGILRSPPSLIERQLLRG